MANLYFSYDKVDGLKIRHLPVDENKKIIIIPHYMAEGFRAKNAKVVIIPKTINGKVIKIIGSDLFNDDPYINNEMHLEQVKKCRESVIDIILPNTVEVIKEHAFVDCTNLERIKLPESIREIWEGAFSHCKSLERIELPENVKVIPKGCFEYCSSLKDINLENIREIGEFAFLYCMDLERIKLPENVKVIPKGCFECCSSLKDINLENIREIGEFAFAYCDNLERIKLPESVKIIPRCCFIHCENLNHINLENIREIGKFAFKECRNLKSITIPYNSKIDRNFSGSGVFYVKIEVKYIYDDDSSNNDYDDLKIDYDIENEPKFDEKSKGGSGCLVFIALAILFSILLIILLI